MPGLLSKIWRRVEKKAPAPAALSVEEKRHAEDAAQLAEYETFDNAVGANPTAKTAQERFNDAAHKGHTRVAADSLKKGATVPSEIYWTSRGGMFPPMAIRDKPLNVAAYQGWTDMVPVLLGGCDQANLETALHTAERKQNAVIARAIRDEMTRRADAQPGGPADPMSLQSSITVSKPLKI